ncbi:PHA/PHB synthase family protein [Amphritea sp. HPY]|uniref:PHA/PHB synthase family protein n=1 Tax=Amphritea sp. HPY TaxID=3421652 RepID=UPI003D7ED990
MLTGNDLFDFYPAINDESQTSEQTNNTLNGTDNNDAIIRIMLQKMFGGVPPEHIMKSFSEWLHCLSADTDKLKALETKFRTDMTEFMIYAQDTSSPDPLRQRRQFSGKEWQQWPYNISSQWYLMLDEWRQTLFTDIKDLSDESESLVNFMSSQLYTSLSPYNYPHTNPETLARTMAEKGENLHRGMKIAQEDRQNERENKPQISKQHRPGKEVAVTPGKVIYRNRLIELIQYEPQTRDVSKNPVLIVPAWIMKYYILDLSPHNSMIKYLVDQGHTVFAISWLNPTKEDRDIGMDDYLDLGLMKALDAVTTIVPDNKVQAVGYCIGGTLLSIGAAAMARDGDDRLQSITLLAAQTDFTEAGEMRLFINDKLLQALDETMANTGYLDSKQMGASFMALRAEDLIWSPMVQKYLHGERPSMNDLMSWNSDGTRMPYRMHSEYLRRLYLNNDLAMGRLQVQDAPIDLADIQVPMFVVGTVTDHVAPWQSVFKIDQSASNTEVTFLLTTGGHNAGIVSGPSHPRRSYQMLTRHNGQEPLNPDTWIEQAPDFEGSWWPAWEHWLMAHSEEKKTATKNLGAPGKGYEALCDAPGTYVLQY